MTLPSVTFSESISLEVRALGARLAQVLKNMDRRMEGVFNPRRSPSDDPLSEGSVQTLRPNDSDLDAGMWTGENRLLSDALAPQESARRNGRARVENEIMGILRNAAGYIQDLSRDMRMRAIAGNLDGTEDRISSLIDQAGKDASEIACMDDFNGRVAAMFGNIKLTSDRLAAIAQDDPGVFKDAGFRPAKLDMLHTRLEYLMDFRDQIISMQESEGQIPAGHIEAARPEDPRPM